MQQGNINKHSKSLKQLKTFSKKNRKQSFVANEQRRKVSVEIHW